MSKHRLKTLLALIVLCVGVALCVFPASVAYAADTYIPVQPGTGTLLGDVNGDGDIDAIDFVWFKHYLLDPSIGIIVEAADFYPDGEINALDLAVMIAAIKYPPIP